MSGFMDVMFDDERGEMIVPGRITASSWDQEPYLGFMPKHEFIALGIGFKSLVFSPVDQVQRLANGFYSVRRPGVHGYVTGYTKNSFDGARKQFMPTRVNDVAGMHGSINGKATMLSAGDLRLSNNIEDTGLTISLDGSLNSQDLSEIGLPQIPSCPFQLSAFLSFEAMAVAGLAVWRWPPTPFAEAEVTL